MLTNNRLGIKTVVSKELIPKPSRKKQISKPTSAGSTKGVLAMNSRRDQGGAKGTPQAKQKRVQDEIMHRPTKTSSS